MRSARLVPVRGPADGYRDAGTAIYYWAPLWPSRVTTALALDGAAPVLVNMRDTSQPLNRDGGETVQSAPLWSATGLDDTVHTLVISVGAGEGIAVVDQLQCVCPSGAGARCAYR